MWMRLIRINCFWRTNNRHRRYNIPLIIVTLTIFSNTSNAVLPPSIFNQEGFKSNTPKLPQKQYSDEESWRYGWMGVNPKKSVTIASMAVMYATRGRVGWRKRFNILELICLLSNDELCLSWCLFRAIICNKWQTTAKIRLNIHPAWRIISIVASSSACSTCTREYRHYLLARESTVPVRLVLYSGI